MATIDLNSLAGEDAVFIALESFHVECVLIFESFKVSFFLSFFVGFSSLGSLQSLA